MKGIHPETAETIFEEEPCKHDVGHEDATKGRSEIPATNHGDPFVGLEARLEYMKEAVRPASTENGPSSAELDDAMVQAYMLSNGHSREKKAAEVLLAKSIPNFHDEAAQVVETILRDNFKEPAMVKRIAVKKVQKLRAAVAAHLKINFETEREIRKRRVGYFRYITASAENKMTRSRAVSIDFCFKIV